MIDLVREMRLRASPVVQAAILWYFIRAFEKTNRHPLPAIILFIAHAILLDRRLMDCLTKRRSLSSFVKEIARCKQLNRIQCLGQTMPNTLTRSTAALDILVGAGMVKWHFHIAALSATPETEMPATADLKGSLRESCLQAERLAMLFAKFGDTASIIDELGVRL